MDAYSGYNRVSISHDDKNKTTFTLPLGTFTFKRMSFGLCTAPATFQRYMMSIFSYIAEDTIEMFMNDFLIVGYSSDLYFSRRGTEKI